MLAHFHFEAADIDARVKVDVLLNRQILVKPEMLRHVADDFLYLLGLVDYIEARDMSFAPGRLEQPAEHLESGGLARAVGSQQAEYLTFGNLEIYIPDSDDIAELLAKAGYIDGELGGVEAVVMIVVLHRILY